MKNVLRNVLSLLHEDLLRCSIENSDSIFDKVGEQIEMPVFWVVMEHRMLLLRHLRDKMGLTSTK